MHQIGPEVRVTPRRSHGKEAQSIKVIRETLQNRHTFDLTLKSLTGFLQLACVHSMFAAIAHGTRSKVCAVQAALWLDPAPPLFLIRDLR